MDEFASLDPSRILFVAGEARRASKATVKPLRLPGGHSRGDAGQHRPIVRIHGVKMLYCITLRPLFFRGSVQKARVSTVLHELFHISPLFDGSLAESRRHRFGDGHFAAQFRPLFRRYWLRASRHAIEPFGHNGPVKVWQWLERPSTWVTEEQADSARRVYTERQLFVGSVDMVSGRTSLPGG